MNLAESVTEWLQLWRDGDDQALARVTDLVYRDLKRLAAYYIAGESNADLLQPTALVHEAYLRVAAVRDVDWKGRGQFIAIVAQMMRRILVDRARARKAAKRDAAQGDAPQSWAAAAPLIDILAVDQALERMSSHYPRCAQVVELRFFGDLEFAEIAQSLEVSLATVERDWRFARAWLQDKMVPSSA